MNSPNVKRMLDARGIRPTPCWSRIGEGWIPIVERCLDALIAAGWNRELMQVKEKFGGLRVYLGEHHKEHEDIVAEACAEAARTCEDCGAPGFLRSGVDPWIRTLCGGCYEAFLDRRLR